MFNMLGRLVSLAERKHLSFSRVFVSLGAQLDFTKVNSGTIVVQNKPGRAEALLRGGVTSGVWLQAESGHRRCLVTSGVWLRSGRLEVFGAQIKEE
eukprot:3107182-Karenia_brevis.AAC.1